MRKNRDVKHATTKAKRNYLVSQRNYHISKLVSGDVLAIGMEKKTSKRVMYELCYDNAKLKYERELNLCYMVTA